MRTLLLLPVAAASLVLAQNALAQQAAPAQQDSSQRQAGRANFQGRQGRASQLERASKTLNLTAAQQQKAHELFQEESVVAKGLEPKLQANRVAMKEAIRRGASAEEIDRLAAEGTAAHLVRNATHAKTMARLYAMLTPEQKKTFDEHPELSDAQAGRRGQRFRGAPAPQK